MVPEPVVDWHNKLRRILEPALFSALALMTLAVPGLAQQQPLRPSVIAQATSPQSPLDTSAGAAKPAVVDDRGPTGLDTQSTTDPDIQFGRDPVSDVAPDNGTLIDGRPQSADTADTLGQLDPDLRMAKDRDAFENPPAGHNPQLFQIEQTQPLRDRRTEQFFENDPFEHIGWRLGSFILFQELEVSPAWDSNVFFQESAQSDWNAAFKSETRLVSNWSNHAVEFRMIQNRTYQREFTSQNSAGQTYELRGRLDVTARTTIEAVGAREIAQESGNSVDNRGSASGDRPDVTTDRLNVTLNHRFNRLSLQLRGGLADTGYGDAPANTPNDRDLTTHTLALRAQWEFRPTFSVFGEIERDERRHPAAAVNDDLTRNSEGERYRAGVALGQTGEFLRGEASIGYGIQRPAASPLPDVEAFLVDANVAWRITPLTSALFEAATSIGETTLSGSSGVINRRVGIRLRHSFTNRLTAEAGVSYGTQNYEGATLREHDVTLKSGVEYSFNRHLALFGRLEHVRFRSNAPDRDYNASTILFGARLRN
jgi:hypothetical protein